MEELLASAFRLSVPLLYAALGGLLCERVGIATICLEGAMIAGAWAAAATAYHTGSPYWGALAAIGAGALTLGLHGLLTLRAKTDHIVSGVAVNLAAAGLTPLFSKAFFGSPSNTPSLALDQRFLPIPIPGLSSLPWVGHSLFTQTILGYGAFLLPFFVLLVLRRTRIGQHLWAAGDGPRALAAAGVRVEPVRWGGLLCGGAFAALGGAFLSTAHASQFTRDMSAGRGYIALAALLFGGWRPLPTAAACLLFAVADAAQIRLQSAEIFSFHFPVQFIQALPYLVTLFALVLFVRRSQPPSAIGEAVAQPTLPQ